MWLELEIQFTDEMNLPSMNWNLEKKMSGMDFWYWYDVVAIILVC